MKTIKFPLVFTLLAGITLLCSCITNIRKNSEIVQKELNDQVFHKITVGSFFRVKLSESETYKVEITLSKHLEPNLISRIENGELIVSLDHFEIPLNKLNYNDRVELEISAPSFDVIEMDGASKFILEGNWTLDDVSFNIKGTSKLECENVEAKHVTIHQAGASSFEAKMSVEHLNIVNSGACKMVIEPSSDQVGSRMTLATSGASKVDLSALTFDYIKVDAVGASKIEVHPLKELEARAAGASKVKYKASSSSLQKKIEKMGVSIIEAY